MKNKRKLIYGLIFVVFLCAFFVKRHFIVAERQSKTVTVAGEWEEKGKPVIAIKIKPKNVNVYSKITVTKDYKGNAYAYVCRIVKEKLEIGQEVFCAEKKQPVGRITEVAKEINLDTGMFLVKISFIEDVFNDSSYAVVYVNTETLGNVICVPREIISSDGKENFIWVIENGKARKRQVKIKCHNGYGSVIEEGLDESDIVVLEGYTFLSESDKVNIIKFY